MLEFIKALAGGIVIVAASYLWIVGIILICG